MKNKLPQICYWCGVPLTKDTKQREHIPPFSFFPKGLRQNLMTVPSCKDHNQCLSGLDEKYQLIIKLFKSNDIAKADLEDRVARGLNRKERKNFVKELEKNTHSGFINDKPHIFMKLNDKETKKFLEKIIRGIFFYHKESPAKGIVQSISKHILNTKIDSIGATNFLIKDINRNILTRGAYNNPEVFKYQYLDYSKMFIIFMQFYDHTEFIGWVFPENFTFD